MGWAGVVVASLVVAAGCGSGTTSDSDGADGSADDATLVAEDATVVAEGPSGEEFYVPPEPLPAGEPGDVIWATPMNGPPGTSAWRILYRSTKLDGEPKAVSGMLLAPDPLPDEMPLPILALAHGATGLADDCAPSIVVDTEPEMVEVMGLPSELTSTYVIVATDYEGLGTPGVHPYAVNLTVGQDVLDSIRAAQRFPDIGTTIESKSEAWGYSQGGGAALLAAELAPSYAPDANLVGAVAGAPAAELKLLAGALRESPYFAILVMAGAGYEAAYPDLDLGTAYTPEGVAATERAAEMCFTDAVETFRGDDPDRYLSADPGTVEPFATILEDNTPGVRSTEVPIFLYQGEADEQVPVIASELVLDRYCRNGTPAYRKTWPGADHLGVVSLAQPDIVTYLQDRLDELPPPSSC